MLSSAEATLGGPEALLLLSILVSTLYIWMRYL